MNPTTKTQLTQALHRPLIQYLLLFLITMCVYLPTMWYTFVWDDYGMIAYNESIREWDMIPKYFTDPSTFTQAAQGKPYTYSWRPVRNIYFLITYKIHGLRPAGWHFQQVLLHCTCTLLLLAFFRSVFRYHKQSRHLTTPALLATWFAALLWAVHPALTEVLGWMKAADDIIACICGLATLILLLPPNGKPTTTRIIIASILYPIGLLTKESLPPLAAIYPMLVIILAPTLRDALRNRRAIIATAILAIQTLIFIIIRAQILGKSSQGDYLADNFSLMMATMTTAIVRYLQLTFWPFWPTSQTASYGNWPIAETWLTFSVLASCMLLAVILIICIFIGRRDRIFFAGCLFTLLAFLPVANLVPMLQVLAERFMYFPLMGIALSAAAGIAWMVRPAPAKLSLLPGIICCALIGVTELRLPVWLDEIHLQSDIITKDPGDSRGLLNLGSALLAEGKLNEALTYFNRCIESRSGDARDPYMASIAAADISIRKQKLNLAAAYVKQALKYHPEWPEAHAMNGDILRLNGDPENAIKAYQKAADLDYRPASLYTNIARTYILMGKTEGALRSLSLALDINPSYQPAKALQSELDSKN